jgi:hypothetical protein
VTSGEHQQGHGEPSAQADHRMIPVEKGPLSLIEQRQKLEQATKDRIQALLKEDQDNHARTATRHTEILAELKLLGWKRTRTPKEDSAPANDAA